MSEKDGKRGWIIVCACFMSGFLYDGVCYSYGLIFIELLGAFNESKALTAGVSSVMFSMAMTGPLAGMFINRFGCRVTNVLAGSSLALGYILSAFCTGIIYLYFSIGILVGLGLPALEVTRSVIIVHYFMKRRSLARGISTCGSGIGTIVFNPLSKWLIDEYGWRGTLLIEGGIALNLVACGLLMRPFSEPAVTELNLYLAATNMFLGQCFLGAGMIIMWRTPAWGFLHWICRALGDHWSPNINNFLNLEFHPMKTLADHSSVTFAGNTQENKAHLNGAHPYGAHQYTSELETGDHLETLLNKTTDEAPTTSNKQSDNEKCLNTKLFKTPSFLIVIASSFFLGMAFFAPFTFIPDMTVSSGWTRQHATWLMTAIGIANTTGRILIGLLMDIKCLNRVLSFVAIHVLLGALTAAMPFCQQYSLLMTVCIGFGVLTSGQSILTPLILADLFGEKLIADTFAFFAGAWGVGSLVVGPLTGAIFDASGSYTLAFVAIGAAFVLSGVLYIPLYTLSAGKTDGNKRSTSTS